MRRKTTTLALIFGAALPLLSACTTARAYAQTRSRESSRESSRDSSRDIDRSSDNSFHWSGTVREGRWVYIRNLNGPVRVEAGTGDKVEVRAEKHWRRGNPDDVRITVKQAGSGDGDVVVCALWNDRSSCDEDGYHSHSDNFWRNNDHNDVQVEFVVRLPAGVKVEATTVNGDVDIDGATSTVAARTVNGSVIANSSGGMVTAHTTNGDVDVRSAKLDDRAEYTTTNGSITVALPASVNADVQLRTVNGRLTSDFPLTVEGSFNPRSLNATLGRGGPRLRLSTVNGSIRLRKLS